MRTVWDTAEWTPPTVTRVTVIPIEAGNIADCTHCGRWLKFHGHHGKHRNQQTVANVYIGGRWNRTDHWHPDCYQAAGQPHGAPQ